MNSPARSHNEGDRQDHTIKIPNYDRSQTTTDMKVFEIFRVDITNITSYIIYAPTVRRLSGQDGRLAAGVPPVTH